MISCEWQAQHSVRVSAAGIEKKTAVLTLALARAGDLLCCRIRFRESFFLGRLSGSRTLIVTLLKRCRYCATERNLRVRCCRFSLLKGLRQNQLFPGPRRYLHEEALRSCMSFHQDRLTAPAALQGRVVRSFPDFVGFYCPLNNTALSPNPAFLRITTLVARMQWLVYYGDICDSSAALEILGIVAPVSYHGVTQ